MAVCLVNHPDELQEIVKVAKDLENQGKLKESKHRYLDAADLALKLSKNEKTTKKLSFEYLAKELVKYAKEIQMEILLVNNQLPLPPGATVQNTLTKQARKLIPKKEEVQLFQLLIIREGGIPVYSYSFSEISNSTRLKLNEILFSGAITAINQIMMEVLEKSIQTIKFEDGVLMIQPANKLYIIIYASYEDEDISAKMKSYCDSIVDKFGDTIDSCVMSGKTLNEDPELTSHMKNYFLI